MRSLREPVDPAPFVGWFNERVEKHDGEQWSALGDIGWANEAGERRINRYREGQRAEREAIERALLHADVDWSDVYDDEAPTRVVPLRGNRFVRGWTTERVVERIKVWTREVGEPPRSTDWNPAKARWHAERASEKLSLWLQRAGLFDSGEWPSTSTVRDLFGSFNAALEQAGFESRPPGRTPRDLTRRQMAALRDHMRGERAGPSRLAVKLKAVTEARQSGDSMSLRSALFDLAATAMAWCEQLDELADESEAA